MSHTTETPLDQGEGLLQATCVCLGRSDADQIL